MNNKMKKGSLFIRAYIIIVVFLISFFTTYAYRYEVLDYLYAHKLLFFNINENIVVTLQDELISLDVANENIDEIDKIVSKQIGDFDFQLINLDNYPVVKEDGEEVDAGFIYFYYANGVTPKSRSLKYSSRYQIEFNNTYANLQLYPRFSEFLNWYRVAALCLAVLISFLCTLLIYFDYKKGWHQKIVNKIKTLHCFTAIKKLSVKLILINMVAVILSVSLFVFMYTNRYSFFEFIRETRYENHDFNPFLDDLRTTSANLNMSKKNKEKVSAIFKEYEREDLSFYLFDEKNLFYVGGETRAIGNYFVRDGFYDVSAIYTPSINMYAVPFKDQVATVTIYSYPLMDFIIPYMVITFLIAFSLYIIIMLQFIKKKVLQINQMQEDVSVLANGDWKHEVSVAGNDEIGELGNHLNQMRVSFLENMENEATARNANHDLISAMSHDLRTPLTTLNGYLEIIQLEKGDKNKRDEYIKRCLDKVNEIRDLSNKMFEYSLVFSAEDTMEMQDISLRKICECLQEHIQYLKLLAFSIQEELLASDLVIKGNEVLLKRLFNNLFSNLQKYADNEKEISIQLSIVKNHWKLVMFNYKKQGTNHVESNGIGLKSVRKIIAIHKGECYINDNDNDFMIIISLPMNGGNE